MRYRGRPSASTGSSARRYRRDSARQHPGPAVRDVGAGHGRRHDKRAASYTSIEEWVGASIFPTIQRVVNRPATTLQHLFSVRVTKVAGFLRPTPPQVLWPWSSLPGEACAEFPSRDLVRCSRVNRPLQLWFRQILRQGGLDLPDRAIITSESWI